MRQKSWRISTVHFALLLLVSISSVGIDSYAHRSAYAATQPAATQSITRTENDPITSTFVFDAEGDTIASNSLSRIPQSILVVFSLFPLP